MSGAVEVRSPFDGSVVDEVPRSGWTEADAALARADALHRARSPLAPHVRLAVLERAAAIIEAEAESLATLATREGGKPIVDSRVEIARAADSVRHCVAALRSGHGEQVPMGLTPASGRRIAFTSPWPIGPVASISAFNHPFNLAVHQMAPAIAAGCPVVLKPSPDTPLSAFSLLDILRRAGLPEEWADVLLLENEAAERLATDPRVAFLSFIGSARVGWHLRSRIAPGTRCALEHGGAAPVYVDRGATHDGLLPALLKGGFYHAGQVCVSVQRVFADEAHAERLAEALAAGAVRLKLGDPLDEGTEVGPMISAAAAERVATWVADAVAGGAELLCGGERTAGGYAPTVLYDPPTDALVSTAEIFGPVVCVYPVRDMAEAAVRANALPFAFQAAVFTPAIDRALEAYRLFDASAVMVNDHTAFRVDWMPFAGLRQSGLGVGGMGQSMRELQVERMLAIRSAALG